MRTVWSGILYPVFCISQEMEGSRWIKDAGRPRVEFAYAKSHDGPADFTPLAARRGTRLASPAQRAEQSAWFALCLRSAFYVPPRPQ